MSHTHTHGRSDVKAVVLGLKNMRLTVRSLLLVFYPLPPAVLCCCWLRLSISIADPKRIWRGFVKEGKLGGWAREGVGAKVGRKVSKYSFIGRKGLIGLEVR